MSLKTFLLALAFCLAQGLSMAQTIDYENPKDYVIGGITVTGVRFLDQQILANLSGLQVGQTVQIPGDDISRAVDKYWEQGLFSDVEVSLVEVIDGKAFLNIYLQERPRLGSVEINGLNKTQTEDMVELVDLRRGQQVTEHVVNTTIRRIQDHYHEKGFLKVGVEVIQRPDSVLPNTNNLVVNVEKGEKVKVAEITLSGNQVLADRQVYRALKSTKRKRSLRLKSAKYVADTYREDLELLLTKYRELGYRDARVASDTVYDFEENTVKIEIAIEEGRQYFFRDITWLGNSKYSSEELGRALGIAKGDVFDQMALDMRLSYDQDAVSNLYLDDGYLFFSATPIEKQVSNDSIDLEIRIYEGRQATIRNVVISGNTKTNEHVVRRELFSRPGDLFSKTNIQRSVRELAQLGHFNPETLNVLPFPDPATGTVDLEYVLEETANDQIEISGGWGADMIIGTVGLRFNNFAAKDMFKKGAWRPVPMGDGQQLSIRVQSNGQRFQSYNFSFMEPWLGGKKPNSLTTSVYHTIQTNGLRREDTRYGMFQISGASVGLGRRLRVPDDFFTLYNALSFQRYELQNWTNFGLFTNGVANNLSFQTILSRNSAGPSPIYPRGGANFEAGLQVTPPYSLWKEDDFWKLDAEQSEGLTAAEVSNLESRTRYRWIEYHKWTFKAEWYTQLVEKLVLMTRYHFGYLGMYNANWGPSPFEGYAVGGDGMMGFQLFGQEVIALRGYESTTTLTPAAGGNVYNKFTMEMRYPLSLNPSATIYALGFLEGGNVWNDYTQFDPFRMYRSAGVGVRIFLPMIGMMGIDWGYGFDKAKELGGAGQFHFVLGQQF